MRRSIRHSIQIAGALALYSAGQTVTLAQGPQPAPAGEVVGVGNFAHVVEDLDHSLAFYRDVLGLEPGMAMDFSANPAIQAMGNTPDAESRIATVTVPNFELGIEFIEYRGIDREPQRPHFVDPGAGNMAFRVRDLDGLFPAVRDYEGVNILTAGGEPATVETPNGTMHALFIQDPDGFVIEFADMPNAAGGAEGHIVAGSAFELTVADIDETRRFYNELLGFDFPPVADYNANQQMAATAGAPGASFRQSRTNIPGTSVPMVLIEFKDIERKRLSGRTQDPGTTVLQLEVRDVAALTDKLAAAGVEIVSVGGKPQQVIPGLDIAIVRDPNDLLLELVQRSGP